MFGNPFANMPPIVKNILILNVIVFIAQGVFPKLTMELALYPPMSESFMPWQYITNIFAHGSLSHIFFNMFGVVIFGSMLERVIGSQKFLIFYLACGVGASVLYNAIQTAEFYSVYDSASQLVQNIADNNYMVVKGIQLSSTDDYALSRLYRLSEIPALGASGALFGLLVSFAMFFPDLRLFLLFPPIPIKAKYLALGYVALEFISTLNKVDDGIAHLAHITGALIGFLLTKFWLKKFKHY